MTRKQDGATARAKKFIEEVKHACYKKIPLALGKLAKEHGVNAYAGAACLMAGIIEVVKDGKKYGRGIKLYYWKGGSMSIAEAEQMYYRAYQYLKKNAKPRRKVEEEAHEEEPKSTVLPPPEKTEGDKPIQPAEEVTDTIKATKLAGGVGVKALLGGSPAGSDKLLYIIDREQRSQRQEIGRLEGLHEATEARLDRVALKGNETKALIDGHSDFINSHSKAIDGIQKEQPAIRAVVDSINADLAELENDVAHYASSNQFWRAFALAAGGVVLVGVLLIVFNIL